MVVASVTASPSTVTSIESFLDRQRQLVRHLRWITVLLIHETEILPGSILAYGRPHEHARNRYLPRWSRTGVRIAGVNRVRPDCPRPVRGRCECPPDGSWRPVGGAIRADAIASSAQYVRNPGTPEGLWADAVYLEGPDGLWRCIRPMRRALEQLRGESIRRFLVLDRLLDGVETSAAWDGLGVPDELVAASVSICVQVERWAADEAGAEYERRPRRWRSLPWTQLSEAQQNAIIATTEVPA